MRGRSNLRFPLETKSLPWFYRAVALAALQTGSLQLCCLRIVFITLSQHRSILVSVSAACASGH